jgi:hypothetical protein
MKCNYQSNQYEMMKLKKKLGKRKKSEPTELTRQTK